MDQLQLGNVTCNYTTPADFYAMCGAWLESDHFHHVVTLNPEMVVEATRNSRFAAAIGAATIRVPDGSGLIWARWYLRSPRWGLIPSLFSFLRRPAERIAGIEVIQEVAKLAHEARGGIYLLGGAKQHVQRTAQLLKRALPGLRVHTSPPHTFNISGPQDILADIQAKAPTVLLVAYGSPKQTIWIERHCRHIPSIRIAIGVGGAFAILSEATPRAPAFLRYHNLEWAWRLLLQPQRLPRIWRATITFPLLIYRQKRLTQIASPQ